MGRGVSIVVPHGGRDRLRLLAATLASMRRCRGVDQIILSESGAVPCGRDVASEHGADYVFTCRPGPFDKAGTVNAGTALARASEVLWSDGDFLFEPGFVARAQREMRACGADFYYPYSRVHYLGEDDCEDVLAGRRRASECDPIWVSTPRFDNPGRMTMVRADFVRRHGGMIEGFLGWGCEDDAWLHKAELLGRVEVSTHPDQLIWHLYHRDSGSHGGSAYEDAIRRNPNYADNAALVGRIKAIGSADDFLRRYPPPAHAAPPWAPTLKLVFVAAASSADAPAAALARDWARRIGQVYGAEPRVVVADPAEPVALAGQAADAVAGFADDGEACRGLMAALGAASVLVTGAVAPDELAPDGCCAPLILARTSTQVSKWRSRGLPVWHRPWQESDDPGGRAAPPLVQPLSHVLGIARTWRIRIELDRAELPGTALDRPRFWYVGLHDADSVEILREDIAGAELSAALALGRERIVIQRSAIAVRPPARWTVWPTDRRGRWLDKLSGPVGPDCLS